MLICGTTFIRSGHVWFNITEPSKDEPLVLCVNLTCLDEDCPDDECRITKEDYGWIRDGYPTTIAFSRAKTWNALNILKCLENGSLGKPHQGDVPAKTVAKVIKAALTSKELSDDKKQMLRKTFER